MNIFLLDDPMKPSVHPMFAHVGTWSEGGICKTCGRSSEVLVEPLQVEWDVGSTEIGDFSWCGYHPIVVDRVKTWMQANKFEVRFGRTEVVKPTGRRKVRRVPFPYTGPTLHWLVATSYVRLDERASGIEPVADCPACGQKRTRFVREGIFIPKANWDGQQLFEIDQNRKSAAKFITEDALNQMVKQNFSNYLAVPAGRIGD